MPATIANPATAVAAVAKAMNASGGADSQSGGPAADAPISFDALIKQISANQADPGSGNLLLNLPAADTEDILAAVLPFFEAMGLTQSSAGTLVPGEDKSLKSLRNQDADDPTLDAADQASLAVALGIPAITAGSLPSGKPSSEAASATTAPAMMLAGTPDPAMPLKEDAQGASAPQQQPVDPLRAEAGANRIVSVIAPEAHASEFSSQLAAMTKREIDPLNVSSATALNQSAAAHAAMSLPSHDAPPSLTIQRAVGASGWEQEVGHQVAWLANHAGSRAELVLTPPHMGRIEVSLSVSGDQASATFVSANPAVRDALEAALPRLREVLAESGIQLGQAQVGAENLNQSAQQQKNGDNPAADRFPMLAAAPAQALGTTHATAGLKIGRGLVDVFA